MNKSKINSEITHGNFGLERVLKEMAGEIGVGFVGNAYFVIPSTKSYLTDFLNRYQQSYSDGSLAVYVDTGNGAAIQTAITATKGGRGDCIFVLPGTYTLATAIDMTGRSSTRLMAVNGPMYEVGSTTAVYLIQGGNYANVIMSANSELSGFAIKNKSGYSAVTIPANIFSTNIHNNYFMVVAGAAINIIDASASGANKMGRIHHNRFYTEVTGALTSMIWIAEGYASDVDHNEISISGGTVDAGIVNLSTGGLTNYNIVSEGGGVGSAVITTAITIDDAGTAIGNRCAVGTGQAFSGGTAEHSFVDNRDGASGGATPVQD